MIPEWIMMGTFSGAALKVYGTMSVKWANRDTLECWPSVESIAAASEFSLMTAHRALRELQKGGALRVTKRFNIQGRQLTNMYELAAGERFTEREPRIDRDASDRPPQHRPRSARKAVDNPVEDPVDNGGYQEGVLRPDVSPPGLAGALVKLESQEPESPIDEVVHDRYRPTVVDRVDEIFKLNEFLADQRHAHRLDEERPAVTTEWNASMARLLEVGPANVMRGPVDPGALWTLIEGVFVHLTDSTDNRYPWADDLTPMRIEEHFTRITQDLAQARARRSSSVPGILALVRSQGLRASTEDVLGLGSHALRVINLMKGWEAVCRWDPSGLEEALCLAERAIQAEA